MKKKAMAIAFFALCTGSAWAQIPVTDAAHITLSETGHAETIAKWVEQYKQMEGQLTQMRQQYESLTGTRNLGEIFNNPELKDYLPQEWQKVYDSVRDGGYSGLTGDASAIYQDNQVFDTCASIADSQAKTACESRAVKPSQDKANALAAIDAAKKRLDQINSLMGQINNTSDPKAIAELTARIGSEQAMIQNEQTKLTMYAMASQAEDRLQEQRTREINAKANARKGYSKLPDPSF